MRDYDKEPLIVKDYALHTAFILSPAALVFAFIVDFLNLKTAARSNSQARPCDTRSQIKSKIHSG